MKRERDPRKAKMIWEKDESDNLVLAMNNQEHVNFSFQNPTLLKVVWVWMIFETRLFF